jgi:predicted RNase H-like HicB family nuclease
MPSNHNSRHAGTPFLRRITRRGETMDKVIEALENLVTEIVNDDGVSYEEALKRIQDALTAIS